MRDLTQLPVLTPELLLGSDPLPPPSGPVRFALTEKPEQPTVLRECFKRLGLLYEVERIKDFPFEVDLSLNMLPSVQLALGKMHGSRNRRTRASSADGDDYVLIVNLRGPHLIEQRDREIVLGNGDAILVSSSDPSAFTHRPPGEMLALRFPKTRLAPLLRGADDRIMQMIPATTPALNLLKNYVGLAWEERMTATAELQHLMASHIIDLVAVAAGSIGDGFDAMQNGGTRAAKLQAIKADIGQYLDRPDLSIQELATRHTCTPRFVQRLFEMEGTTFTEYVLTQRLSHAYRKLLDPRYRSEKISAVAYDCGFRDVSYFNRVFRRHFAAAPSDIRGQAPKSVSDSPMLAQ